MTDFGWVGTCGVYGVTLHTVWPPKCHRDRYWEDTKHSTEALTADCVLAGKDGGHREQARLTSRQLTQQRLPPRYQPCWRGSPPGSGQIESIHHCGEQRAAKQISGEMISTVTPGILQSSVSERLPHQRTQRKLNTQWIKEDLKCGS